ncbi:MAG: flavodoxin family protein [Eubacteriales bacterium]|nr:flavodoxin family protein [Eubacteriales bacterium]
MSKKVLIISSSPRKNSNSHALAEEFANGAKASGHDIELISLAGKKIEFCRGCLACQTTKRCVIRDDADQIEQKMEQADVLVFATPIYYYEMSGQMKTMLDRGNPLYTTDYKFRDVYFLSSAAEEEDYVDNRAVSGLEGWIECFPKAKLAGKVCAGGVGATGEVQGHPALEQAYEMGKFV